MVDISVEGDKAVFQVEGLDKLWTLKSRLAIPLSNITGVHEDDDAARGWWHGVRVGATEFPGVITAGSFFSKGRLVFYDVHKPGNTIVIDLEHESYDQLVLQVRDPAASAAILREAIERRV